MKLVAIVTAAGASSRMGRPKALLPWGNATLLEHQVASLAAFPFDRIVVVTGHGHDALASELEALREDHPQLLTVHNPRWELGRSTSFEAAAEALADLLPARALVTAIDQPLAPLVIAALLVQPDQEAVLVPTFEGRRGHPILLPAAGTAQLGRASTFTEGLRDIANQLERREVPVDSPSIHLDLNTPERYAAALEEP